MGSVMIGNVFTVETRKSEVVLQHAKDFLKQYYTSIRRSVNIMKVLKQSIVSTKRLSTALNSYFLELIPKTIEVNPNPC
jgi:hypothetical protein